METLEGRIVLSGLASRLRLYQSVLRRRHRRGRRESCRKRNDDDAGSQRRDARPADHVHRDGARSRRGGLAGGNSEHHRPRRSDSNAHTVADDVDERQVCVQRRHVHPDANRPAAARTFSGNTRSAPTFIPSGTFSKSRGSKTFTVSKPAYTALAGGVKIATIAPGSGPAIQSGQTASVLYTGYLAKNGHIFDDSINDGGTPFSFTLGAGQVIPGFDEGTPACRWERRESF